MVFFSSKIAQKNKELGVSIIATNATAMVASIVLIAVR